MGASSGLGLVLPLGLRLLSFKTSLHANAPKPASRPCGQWIVQSADCIQAPIVPLNDTLLAVHDSAHALDVLAVKMVFLRDCVSEKPMFHLVD